MKSARSRSLNAMHEPSRRKLSFETMEHRRVMAAVSIHETVDRTMLNDNGYGADFYDIALDTKPTSTVAFNLSSNSPVVNLFSQQSFTRRVVFTPDDWTPKRISVFGVGDQTVTGNFQAVLSQTVDTQDPQYIGVSVSNVIATIIDTESQPYVQNYDLELVEGESQIFFVDARYPDGYTGPAFGASYDTNQMKIENIGGNTFTLNAINDGVLEGVQDVPISYIPLDPNPGNFSIPTAIIRIRDSDAPTLSNFQVNNGAAQRSIVTNLALNFSAPIFVNPTLVTLTNTTTNLNVPLQITMDSSGLRMNIAFASGSSVINRIGGNTLADGNYVLTVAQNAVTNRQSGAAMSQSIVLGDSADERLFRLFGDLNGNGVVDAPDVVAFARALLTNTNSLNYVAAFDERGDGFIGLDDLLRFARNIGRRRLM